MSTEVEEGVVALARALNDRSRTRIGNPWRGSYHLAVKASIDEAESFIGTLEQLNITARINGEGSTQKVAVYDLPSLRRLLEVFSVDLEESPREALDALVRARGPVPQRIVEAVRVKRDLHRMSFEAIARLMNEKGLVDGMRGRGWTAKKVRAAYKGLPA